MHANKTFAFIRVQSRPILSWPNCDNRITDPMCGIAGQLLRDRKAELAEIRSMCDQIRHRGPDDEGYHLDGGCGLGMRRLSVIDLSTGHQPISNEDGTITVVYSGEIYNFAEIREELIGFGHHFTSHTDTEVIVHGYEQWGEAVLDRCNGMFAVALWDDRTKTLWMARDRLG